MWRIPNLGASFVLIDNGILYARAAEPPADPIARLYAYDVKTGKQLWRSAFAVNDSDSTTVTNGIAYIVGYPPNTYEKTTSRLHALDPKSGKQLWETTLPVGALRYVTAKQICVTEGGRTHILDAKTGEALPTALPVSVVRAAAADDIAYSLSKDATVRASSATEIIWTAKLPHASFEGPIISGDNIYFYCVSAEDYKGCHTPSGELLPDWGIYALHRQTGELRWKWRPEDYRLGGLETDADRVYISAWNDAGAAIILDPAAGQAKWTHLLNWNGRDHYFRKVYRKPVLLDANAVAYFDQPSNKLPGFDRDNLEDKALGTVLHAYNRATGELLWESKLPWKYDDWVINDGLLFASDGGPNSWKTSNYKHAPDAWLTALDLRTGAELWRSRIWKLATLSNPMAGDGMVVVGTRPEPDSAEPQMQLLAFPAAREPHRK